MESELQKQMVDMEAFTMIARLKEMCQKQARIVNNSALGLLYGHGILTIYENLLL